MAIKDIIFGNSFVYDTIRPFLIGGLDFSYLYDLLEISCDDIILDIGCGTGDIFHYINDFKEYHGFDTDSNALKSIPLNRSNIFLYNKELNANDIKLISPTKVCCIGLFHHLSDSQASYVVQLLNTADSIETILTLDVQYMQGRFLNNLFSFLDRGKFVRNRENYLRLLKFDRYQCEIFDIFTSGNRKIHYFVTKWSKLIPY